MRELREEAAMSDNIETNVNYIDLKSRLRSTSELWFKESEDNRKRYGHVYAERFLNIAIDAIFEIERINK